MQARIKAKAIAINTFLPKNGYRPLDMNIYTQQRYTTSFYLPPVYSPQQQFPLYSLIAPQTWSTTHSYLDPSLVSLLLTKWLCSAQSWYFCCEVLRCGLGSISIFKMRLRYKFFLKSFRLLPMTYRINWEQHLVSSWTVVLFFTF